MITAKRSKFASIACSGDLITYAVCLCYKYGSPDPIISQDCDESLLHMLSG